jgi:hypothetical protein
MDYLPLSARAQAINRPVGRGGQKVARRPTETVLDATVAAVGESMR